MPSLGCSFLPIFCSEETTFFSESSIPRCIGRRRRSHVSSFVTEGDFFALPLSQLARTAFNVFDPVKLKLPLSPLRFAPGYTDLQGGPSRGDVWYRSKLYHPSPVSDPLSELSLSSRTISRVEREKNINKIG